MTATKDQERKALAQIKKIVESLGEDSYIAAAFDGCFEIAENNINNDFMNSWKGAAEIHRKEGEDLRKDINHLKAQLTESEKTRLQQQELIANLEHQILNADDTHDVLDLIKDRTATAKEEQDNAATTVLSLVDNTASAEFAQAVKDMKNAEADAKYYTALYERIEKTRG